MFDPSQPATNSALSSAVMRSQLTSLKALIDAIVSIIAAQVDGVTTVNPGDPAAATVTLAGSTLHFTFAIPRGLEGQAGQNGQDGGIGPMGPPFAQAVVDAVNTLNPGDNATVGVSFDGTFVHFTFAIPRGNDGQQGQPGQPGQTGAQGPPFAQAMIDAVNTLNPGDNATVSVSFDGTHVHFTFGIPRGADGIQGPPGEVTNAQLTTAIATTAQNPSSIQPLNIAFSDPPTSGELTQMQSKINELITALIRP